MGAAVARGIGTTGASERSRTTEAMRSSRTAEAIGNTADDRNPASPNTCCATIVPRALV